MPRGGAAGFGETGESWGESWEKVLMHFIWMAASGFDFNSKLVLGISNHFDNCKHLQSANPI